MSTQRLVLIVFAVLVAVLGGSALAQGLIVKKIGFGPFSVDFGTNGGSQSPGPPTVSLAPASTATAAPPREKVIHIDDAPATSPNNVRVLKITALSRNDPPQVNNRVTIHFSLQNVGQEPITLNSRFIGARDPADNNVDFGHENYDKVLAPDEVINIKNSTIVKEQGVWKFWPCYMIGNTYCPDEWRAFQILVER